ncbi:hypothetical protein GCM10023075_36120 [Streptosporangium album]
MSVVLPAYDDVLAAAAANLAPHTHRTPAMRSRLIDEEIGAEVLFKCENLQRMGAFKFRGAYNALSRLSPGQRRAGVIAFSSGNHAQAVALAARILEIPATLVMPADAPAAKLAATREYRGQVVTYDRYADDREEICRTLATERGLTLIPPFDHPHVIAGQGTAAKELFATRPASSTRSSCRSGAAACWPVRLSPPGPCRLGAGSMEWSQKRATTACARYARARSCASTPRAPSPTGRRPSSSACTPSPLSGTRSTTSSPSATPSSSTRCSCSPRG